MWLLGDVHGCAEELEELIKEIRKADSEWTHSTIICLGDLIDRGPYLEEVFDVLIENDVISIIGNHEMNFFREAIGNQPCRSNARKATLEVFKTLSSESKEKILSYIASSEAWYEVGSDFISHSIPSAYGLMNRSSCGASNFCTKSDLAGLDHPVYEKFHRFYHGHMHWNYVDIEQQIVNNEKFINLDSGCVYGGHLTAISKYTDQVIQVKAKKTYYNHQN